MLRTSLTLSLLTGKPFHLVNIRAGREKPGLRPQHLEAVRAAQRIGSAQVEGASERSMTLSFTPGERVGGSDNYRFEIRTAGSTTLVLQTIFLPLALAGRTPVRRNAVSPARRPPTMSAGRTPVKRDQVLTPSPLPPQGGEGQGEWGNGPEEKATAPPALSARDAAARPVRVVIGGGTHVEWSPSFHYIALQWLPMLRRMGFEAELKLNMAGFYPRGGGEIECVIKPAAEPILPIQLTERGAVRRLRIISAIGQLPLEIAERQKRQAEKRLAGLKGYEIESENLPVPAPAPGTMLLAMAEHEYGAGCFCALGARGKRAERVADEACDALMAYLEGDAGVDDYLSDQLVLPAAVAEGESCWRAKVTQHLLTNLHVVQSFLPVQAQVEGEEGKVAMVRLASGETLKTRHSCG